MARVSRRKQIAAAQGLPVDELPKAAALRIFRTALYVRLSIMDTRDRKDSESLQTQIDYLCGYIAKHPDLELYDCYRDNGETGTNFERPGFQRMMEDVKAGRVDCIIVKDLSRFGRDFLETGNFLEKVLPFMGVRFISVNDNYDSIRADSGEAMTIALKNLMNDIYAKDISQKVYSALDTKKRSGEFIGNFAAYGYVKSPEDRHKLAVDPDAAKVVRRIFRMKKNGMSNAAIARTLTAEQIPNPNYHRYLQGVVFTKRFSENSPWQTQTVKHILENPVYLGQMVQGKKITKLHAGQKQKIMPPSEWIIVPNTHEAIIEQELFDAVQAILKVKHEEYHSRLGKYAHFDSENIFEGLVVCACCQHNMTRYKSVYNKGRTVAYHFICPRHATPKYECVLVDPNDLNRKHIYIQVKKGDVDLNTDDYSSLNGEVYLLTTEGNVQNAQKYSNVKVADPTVVYEFAINPDKSHIIPENVLYWVKFLTEIENNRLKFSACKGIMFDTNISYSDTNESEMILGNKIAAYGDAKRYIDSFRKDDYALFYSKGRGIIAVGQIVTDTPTEVGDEKYHSVRMIVPENFNGDVKALPALSPNEIKTILKRNFYWASTIKTPFLTGAQVEMLIRELKKKHISAFGKYKIEY